MMHSFKKYFFIWSMFLFFNVFQVHSYVYFAPIDIQTSTFLIDNPGEYAFYNNMTYNYDPATEIPMMKIVASDVVVDFNKIGITNISNLSGVISAIEVGWSPAELAADSNRVQPKNITLKNISLNMFDVGIIVHEGVKRVFINNANINNGCVGIIFAGTSDMSIEQVSLSNISIFGDGKDHHDCLVNLKTLLEVTFGYGADYFIKLIADPNNGNMVDVYSYYGIWINNLFTLNMDNVLIRNIGYNYKGFGSAGNGKRTQAIGTVFRNSKNINIDTMTIYSVIGEINSVGVLLDNDANVFISNSKFSYNIAGQIAAGIKVTNDVAANNSITALALDKVNTRNNISDNIAIGMDLSSVRGLMATDLSSKFNKGAYQTYGLYIDNGSTINISNSTFSENEATRETNDVATTFGISAYGFYGNNINGMQILNVDFNNMQALNSAYGLYLNNSSSVLFTDCQLVANKAIKMRSGEAADIRAQQDAQEISKHAPVVNATSTGAYGAFITNTNYIKFQSCLANSNTAHRAIGLNFKNCKSVVIYDTFSSTQYGSGSMIDSSFVTDNIANPSAVAIKPNHIPLFFGGQSKTTVDVISATDLFLEKMSSIRASQIAGDNLSYNDLIAIIATSSLLEGVIARYRLWGVGIGIHAYNVTGFLLKNCSCAGNISIFDNGIGICFSGRNANHSVVDSNLLFNIGSYASIITKSTNPLSEYQYSYNLMGMKPYWSTLLQTDVWTNISNNSMGSAVNSVALSPNGNYLAVCMANNDIKILNPNTGLVVATLSGHSAPVASLVFSPDGTMLASGSASATNNIKIWETSNWTNIQTLTHASTGVNVIVWNNAGTRIASGATVDLALTTPNIITWNTSTWSSVATISQGIGAVAVTSLVYNNDDTLLVSGSNEASNNIKVWNISSLINLQTLSGHTNAINSLSFNPSGTLLASASKDDLIKIWNTSSWALLQTITASAGDVNAVAFKNDGKLLASAHADNSLRIWSTTDWSSVKTFTDHTQAITSLAWSNDGKRIVSGSLDGYAKYYSTNIFSKATSTTQAGIYNPSVYFTVQGQKRYGNESMGDDVFIRLKSKDRVLISPVGPIGAGILMGDLLVEGVVQNCNLYANLGNAGYTSGVILDNSYSVTIDSNLISGNIANVYGVSVGIQDRTAHSQNLFMKNFLEGNKCSTFNNSNYFVPFNPADSYNLSLPITKIMNGKFLNASTLFDNIEVLYSQNPESYNIEYLASVPQHPDLVSYWSNNNFWS